MKENSGMKYVQNYSDALKYVYAQLPMFQRQGAAAYKRIYTIHWHYVKF